jgi:nucleotide-binding universal stress UspA family protein
MRRIRKILVPTDFSPASEEAFQMASTLALATGAEVLAVHVVVPPAFVTPDGKVVADASTADAKDLLEQLRKLQPEDPRPRVDHRLIVAKKADAAHILEVIEDLGADLIVIGSTGRTGLKHWLFGSLAEDVVQNAVCPVMVVKAPPGAKAE